MVKIVFFIYCVCLFPFANFFHLCCATRYDGEIKLYIYKAVYSAATHGSKARRMCEGPTMLGPN